ncbi:MAG: hypothetical protein ACYTFO_06920, partial [Planctomycetota bacterium]
MRAQVEGGADDAFEDPSSFQEASSPELAEQTSAEPELGDTAENVSPAPDTPDVSPEETLSEETLPEETPASSQLAGELAVDADADLP